MRLELFQCRFLERQTKEISAIIVIEPVEQLDSLAESFERRPKAKSAGELALAMTQE
jgi:hypothetical protein